MREMKYVVAKTNSGPEQIFIFPKEIDHDSFAAVTSYIKEGSSRDWRREHRQIVSAGFTDGTRCYGRSETLNLDSRKSDSTLLS